MSTTHTYSPEANRLLSELETLALQNPSLLEVSAYIAKVKDKEEEPWLTGLRAIHRLAHQQVVAKKLGDEALARYEEAYNLSGLATR